MMDDGVVLSYDLVNMYYQYIKLHCGSPANTDTAHI